MTLNSLVLRYTMKHIDKLTDKEPIKLAKLLEESERSQIIGAASLNEIAR